MGDPIYHNWQQIVEDLLATDLTQQQLADRCHCSQSYIHKIKSGDLKGDPGTTIGVALLNLHRYRCRITKG